MIYICMVYVCAGPYTHTIKPHVGRTTVRLFLGTLLLFESWHTIIVIEVAMCNCYRTRLVPIVKCVHMMTYLFSDTVVSRSIHCNFGYFRTLLIQCITCHINTTHTHLVLLTHPRLVKAN